MKKCLHSYKWGATAHETISFFVKMPDAIKLGAPAELEEERSWRDLQSTEDIL